MIAHGSRDPQGNEAFFQFVRKFRKAFPQRKVEAAFLELAKPSIPEGIENCMASGADEIFVVPMMVFPGRHVKEHIPAFIEAAKEKYPGVDFHYAGPLSDNRAFMNLVEQKARSVKRKGNSKVGKR